MTFAEWLERLFSNESFLLPFYSTVSAALVLMLLQYLHRLVRERKQKLYAVAYILDVAFRLQRSAFILIRHTLDPHIETTKRILDGDAKLLETTFLADEFDILKAGPMAFNHLSEESKVLLGYDDIELVQAFDSATYISTLDENRRDLNDFVKHNLKDQNRFQSLTAEQRQAILFTYWDCLSSLKLEEERTIFFIANIIVPKIETYLAQWQFLLFSTKASKRSLDRIAIDQREYAELLPEPDFMEKRRTSGIQSIL